MSLDYASSLSPYPNKGKLGLPEFHDPTDIVKSKCEDLANLINKSMHIVVITGAGLSTSCGISDFRGPNGIWTLEKKGLKPENNMSFEEAIPSYSHYALVELCKIGKIKFLISQNIDGLHMRSGFPVNRLAEVHGNMFVEKCNSCSGKYIFKKNVTTIGLKLTGKKCTRQKQKGNCRGQLQDTILDWEDALPAEEMALSELHCKKSDLIICLGTSLQIMPVGNYPLLTKKNNGKIVIVNLQKTRMDKHADLIINAKLDLVFENLFEIMSLKVNNQNLIEIRLNLDNDENQDSLLLNVKNVSIDQAYSEKIDKTNIIEPNLVLIFSGKRKSGKDYVCQKLLESFNNNSESINIQLITLSAPLKEAYAQENNLDYEKLLDSSEYKEKYRKDMIDWSETKREIDPGYFCRKAVDNVIKTMKNNTNIFKKFIIFIITDARRKSDLEYFRTTYPNSIKTVRIYVDDEVRSQRNWKFTPGIDDAVSECGLDDVKFDFKINNNNDLEMNDSMQKLIDFLNTASKIVN